MELTYRTEGLRHEEIRRLFVETLRDRGIITRLKGKSPVVLVGSRGAGKSFLLRMAEVELRDAFAKERILPVYVTFHRSILVQASNSGKFHAWMMSHLCTSIVRVLRQLGEVPVEFSGLSVLTGGKAHAPQQTELELVQRALEESWQNPGKEVDATSVPSTERLLEAIEDVCVKRRISRVVILIDEAAHVFQPDQQREFFTMFRDLRSPFVSCKAAVYPGVTAYGDVFEPAHDAAMLTVRRDVLDGDYLENMREIVLRQMDVTNRRAVERYGENFDILAYAATGNPRHLLKTVGDTGRLRRERVNETIREFYREGIWAEHSNMAAKYPGYRWLIDWGRDFVDKTVLPELHRKNEAYRKTEDDTTASFWIHRDAPQPVTDALNLLAYAGIVSQLGSGLKATRKEIGTRYMVNLGCLLALEVMPSATGLAIAKAIARKRMTEYGKEHPAYESLGGGAPTFGEPDMAAVLKQQLDQPLSVLDITEYQRQELGKIGLLTIGDILRASESRLQEAPWIGVKRSRRIRNAADSAVFEYLNG